MNLSSPNRMVWNYFEALRRLVGSLASISDDAELKQNIAVSIMLSVTVVEACLNIFFRVVVSEAGFTQHEKTVLEDLAKRKSLDYKLKNWPKRIFGKGLDFTSPLPAAFLSLKEHRNALMHFTSSHETLRLPGVEIRGLADTTVFERLNPKDALDALSVAEGMVCELFRLRGAPEAQLPHALHLWTGKVPI